MYLILKVYFKKRENIFHNIICMLYSTNIYDFTMGIIYKKIRNYFKIEYSLKYNIWKIVFKIILISYNFIRLITFIAENSRFHVV